jgi:cytochrome c oxidase subunit IV
LLQQTGHALSRFFMLQRQHPREPAAELIVRWQNAMNDTHPIPTSLKVGATLFILSGISSLLEIIMSLLHGHISLNFGVLSLVIGAGLLRLSPTCRTWALVFTWIAVVGAPLVGLIFLIVPGPLDFALFGQPVGQAPKAAGVAVAGVVFLVALWQYRVLTRPDVRALFRPPTADHAPQPTGHANDAPSWGL